MSQNKTLEQYHHLIQLNSASHLIRTAREMGLFDALKPGQQTAAQLIQQLRLRPEMAHPFLDALRAIGVIEQYEEDFALAHVTRLLCDHDADLGDSMWERLPIALREPHDADSDRYHASNAATQWTHTKGAMEVAEILGIGIERTGARILDLGCGSAVWSCAMAFRDASCTLTVVDLPGALAAANQTAQSIELGDRYRELPGRIDQVDLPAAAFDLVILATRLHALSHDDGITLLRRVHESLAEGGEVVIIDFFTMAGKTSLADAAEALRLKLTTRDGSVRSFSETERQVQNSGFRDIQIVPLTDTKFSLGIMVARKE